MTLKQAKIMSWRLSMDEIMNVKSEFRTKQWANIIQDCKASGMTAVSWCDKNNVSVKSYYYWLRKLRTAAYRQGSLPAPNGIQQIVPLSLERISSAQSAITVRVASFSVDIGNGASKEAIRSVLETLKAIC